MHLKKYYSVLIYIVLLLFTMPVFALGKTYTGNLVFGARSLSLGGTNITDNSDAWAIHSNPAALGLMTDNAVINYSYNNKFSIDNFGENQMALIFRNWGPVRVGIANVNNSASLLEENAVNLWRNSRMLVGFGLQVSPGLAVGASWQRVAFSLDLEEGSKVQKNNLFNVGFLYDVDNLSIGIAAHDLGEKEFSPNYHFGVAYRLGKFSYKFQISNLASALGDEREKQISLGVELDFARGVVLRAGCNTDKLGKLPNVTVGAGFSLKNISIDYAYVTPFQIQGTHQISSTYHF